MRRFFSSVFERWRRRRRALKPDEKKERLKNILYVEDNELQARLFIRKCEDATSCFVVHETDGKKALGRLAKGEKYDIVISDVCMPGMDGIAFFRAMFLNNLNEQATANIAVTATPAGSSNSLDKKIHKSLSTLAEDFNVLVFDKNHADKVNLARDVVKPLLESDSCSVDDARVVISSSTSPWNPWDRHLSELPVSNATDPSSSLRSEKSAVSSIGDALLSTCWVDGVRIRCVYTRAFRETKRDDDENANEENSGESAEKCVPF